MTVSHMVVADWRCQEQNAVNIGRAIMTSIIVYDVIQAEVMYF